MPVSKNFIYFVCGFAILVHSFGIKVILLCLATLFALFIGMLIRIMQHGYEKLQEAENDENKAPIRFETGINFPQELKLSVEECDGKYTGSAVIDSCLDEIVNFIIRDYIDSWYTTFTNDPTFTKMIRKTSCKVASKLTLKLRKVDWVTLLTRDLVDDFASHIRLYRRAKEKCTKEANKMKDSDSSSSMGGAGNIDRDLETHFFDFELEMEKGYCRDSVSTSSHYEDAYLHDISTILLYLLLPAEEFSCRPSMLLIREVLVKKALLPLLDLISDPDFVYQTIVWLLADVPLRSEDFLAVLEKSKSFEELAATREALEHEISLQRAKDTGGKDDAAVKQQLSSLLYVHRLISSAIKRLKGHSLTEQENILFRFTDAIAVDEPCSSLSLDFVLTNSFAINYFMDFLSANDAGSLIEAYLNITSFKASSIMKSSDQLLAGSKSDQLMLELKRNALNMLDVYFGCEALKKFSIDPSLIDQTVEKIKTDTHASVWLNDVQTKLVELLRDEKYFGTFKRSETYLKLLTELNLASKRDLQSKNFRFDAETACFAEDALDSISLRSTDSGSGSGELSSNKSDPTPEPNMEYVANIDTVALGNEGFALYNIVVNKYNKNNDIIATWNIVRRYSDFYALHNLIQNKFSSLRILSFPAKKAFNNLSRDLWEKRKRVLNNYLKILMLPSTLENNKGLEVVILDFLCAKEYSNDKSTIGSKLSYLVVNPIKLSVKSFGNAVISVPDVLVDNAVKVGDSLGKVTKSVWGVVSLDSIVNNADDEEENISLDDGRRVGAQIDATESSNNIPLRILLLFMDEVFGVRKRNQWFRRRLVALLHHFIHAAFGTSINRKIIQYVDWLTSEEQVAEYLKAFRNNFWPNGLLSEPTSPKSVSTRMRTRVVAKCKLLAVIPDELQLFMGSETTLDGVFLVFDALQNSRLNRRFSYVLMERLLSTIFPQNKFDEILPRLHAKSPRCSAACLNKTA